MSNLLKAEFYKLFHSWYFWGIGLFNLLLSSVLLLDSVGETSNLFFASIYNMPILYFLTIIFSALFVGNDFGRRTLQSYINAGHRRGKILFAKLVVHQIACMVILSFPLLLHSIIGTFVTKGALASIGIVVMVIASQFAMCLLPFFFAFIFRDIGKSMAVPMVLFFLMVFLMNGDQVQLISQILPMGQLRLMALQQSNISGGQFMFSDFFMGTGIMLRYLSVVPTLGFEITRRCGNEQLTENGKKYQLSHNIFYWCGLNRDIFGLVFLTADTLCPGSYGGLWVGDCYIPRRYF